MIPIYKPYLPPNSLKYAHNALDSSWISSRGPYIQIVQEKLQELLKVKHALPLNNGTSACHLVAKALSKKLGPGVKNLLVPDNVYVAAWNAFLFDQSYDLITVKTDVKTWNIDLNDLDKKILQHPDAAVLIVHNIGNIINVPELQWKYPNTIFVEDNCEGLFGKYNGKNTGTECLASAISFFGNKNITTGEGGCFLTNDTELYEYVNCIQTQGQSKKRFIHDELGYNYRITNIQSALLVGQLEILPQILEMKEKVFSNYREAFKDRKDLFMQKREFATEHANWMFGVRVIGNDYEKAEQFFNARNIEIRQMFFPITSHNYLKDNSAVIVDNCENADILNKECIILPSYPELGNKEQNYIIKTFEEYVKEL